MRTLQQWSPPSSPNHSANQSAGTIKMLPPAVEEGHSPNENTEFPDTANTTCNRSRISRHTATQPICNTVFQTHQKPHVTKSCDTMLTSISCWFCSYRKHQCTVSSTLNYVDKLTQDDAALPESSLLPRPHFSSNDCYFCCCCHV